MKFRNTFGWMSLFSGMVFVGSVHAQGGSAGVQKLEAGKFPGYVMDEVVVPVPSEIFSVLDKLGNNNWHDELRKIRTPDSTDRMELALVFGTVVAEGFVAVQAQDRQAVEDIGHDVINLSKALGLKDSVVPHAQSILDAVKKSDWKGVRKELDLTQATVRATMERMHDADLAQCVSLAGWLRGTASVTSVVNKAYTADRAELLNQPFLVEHFIKAIRTMSGKAQKSPTIKALDNGLGSIRKQMDTPDGNIGGEKVASMKKTCEELLALILKNSTGKSK